MSNWTAFFCGLSLGVLITLGIILSLALFGTVKERIKNEGEDKK